ncbi:MAG: YceI family protein [Pseudomonadales bacterium]|nr:YceI family protein [Pseudomonadales bacterium]
MIVSLGSTTPSNESIQSKGLIPAAVMASMLLFAPAPTLAEADTYSIDPEHFSISFEVMHLGYARVLGLFTDASGTFLYDEASNELSSGTVTIQSKSVFSNHKERDNHLRSGDFLNARKYPEITFTMTNFEATGDKGGKLTGDLTLLGKTHPVTLDLSFNKAADYPFGHGKYTLGISAQTSIQRSQWGINYGLDMVEDDVKLRFELEAIRD